APAPVVAPAADLQSTLADSGLVMVETSAERAAGIEPVIVEQPQLGRRRRPAPVIANEPMQQAADHANGQNGSAPGPDATPPDAQVEQLRAELAQVREE
ncbi:hypothetical protein ABTE60_19785, partial [Acinetobacter baumannii]